MPVELVHDAVAAAATAPSGANQQPWTFVHVTDPHVRARIREAAELEERRSYEGRLGQEWLAALRPLGTDWRKPHLTDAPHLLVVFAQAHRMDPGGARYKHYYVVESVGIACGLLLASGAGRGPDHGMTATRPREMDQSSQCGYFGSTPR